jgi:FtsZ-binding cell division protein ZapB
MNDKERIKKLDDVVKTQMKTIALMAKEIKQLRKEKEKLAFQAYKEINYSEKLQQKIDKLKNQIKTFKEKRK